MRLQILLLLNILASALALQLSSPKRVAEGAEFRIRCLSEPSDKNVWAYRLSFASSFKSFQVLGRVDDEESTIYLNSKGYPSRFETDLTDGDLKLTKIRGEKNFTLIAKLRVQKTPGQLNVSCEAVQFGGRSNIGIKNYSISVYRKPSVTMWLIKRDNTRRRPSPYTKFIPRSTVTVECDIDRGDPPFPTEALYLHFGSSNLHKNQCESTGPNRIRCQWKLTISKSLNDSSIACCLGPKYRSNETKLIIVDPITINLVVKVYACGKSDRFEEVLVRVVPNATVADVRSAFIDQFGEDLPQCDIHIWRWRRKSGLDKRTNKKMFEVDEDFDSRYVSYDGTLKLKKEQVEEIDNSVLDPNKVFIYSKKYSNKIEMFGYKKDATDEK